MRISDIRSCASAGKHAVEDIKELHGQLAAEPLAKEKLLCKREVLVVVPREAKPIIERGGIPDRPGPGEGKFVNVKCRGGRRAVIVARPVHVEPTCSYEVRRVALGCIRQWSAVETETARSDVDWRTAFIPVDHGKLPATDQVSHSGTTVVQELPAGAKRQFIHACHGEHVRLVIIPHGPFGRLVSRVKALEIKGRKTAVRIRQVPRQGVRNQEGQSIARAFLETHLKGIVFVGPVGLEVVGDAADHGKGQEATERQTACTVITPEICVRGKERAGESGPEGVCWTCARIHSGLGKASRLIERLCGWAGPRLPEGTLLKGSFAGALRAGILHETVIERVGWAYSGGEVQVVRVHAGNGKEHIKREFPLDAHDE